MAHPHSTLTSAQASAMMQYFLADDPDLHKELNFSPDIGIKETISEKVSALTGGTEGSHVDETILHPLYPKDIDEFQRRGIRMSVVASSGMLEISDTDERYAPLGIKIHQPGTTANSSGGFVHSNRYTYQLTPEGVTNHPDLLEQALEDERVMINLNELQKLSRQTPINKNTQNL